MSTDSCDAILDRVRMELTPAEQRRLVDELAQIAARKADNRQRSILDLEGLGKEIWQEVDPVDTLRRNVNHGMGR
jgi:hypothetical protein